ncbi:hypothetical protein LCGC14_1616390 [marine sediment metagenome]|uniref:Uncharacterized protein n=1 Tax=marine sediment metagenome TaxID=412755 RepID=A0A0F9ITL5_9ZZZZ
MSKKHKNKHKPNQEVPIKEAAEKSETKKTLKPVPVWKDGDGNLLKLKRADFPYNRNGIIAYCDYRIEYWKIKKQDMLKKVDPLDKVRRKREKLIKALEEVDAQLKTDEKTNS